jgi:hypothetical protein
MRRAAPARGGETSITLIEPITPKPAPSDQHPARMVGVEAGTPIAPRARMRSYPMVSLTSIEVDDGDTMVERSVARAAGTRVWKGTVAVGLALVAFACTFVGAGWNAVSHAPVARAAATIAPPAEPKATTTPDSALESTVVSVPVVKLSAPLSTPPAKTAHAAVASKPKPNPNPKPAPAAPPTRPAPAVDQDSASVRDINAKASSVLDSSL